MKGHDELKAMLAPLAGGDLSPADRVRIEQHLNNCPSCRHELAQLQAVVQAVRSMPEVEPPPWLAFRIMAQIRDKAPPQRSWFERLVVPFRSRLPFGACALLVVCIMAWYVMQEVDRSQQVRTGMQPATLSPAEGTKDAAVQALRPPSATVPAPAVEPETARRQTAVPPVIQKTLETSAVTPVPVIAPPPQTSFNQEEPAEQTRERAEATSADSAVGRERTAGNSAPLAERKAAAKAKAVDTVNRLDTAMKRPLQLRLVVTDRTIATDSLRSIVQRLGGVVLEQSPGSLTVRMQGAFLPELQEQVAKLGRITERNFEQRGNEEWVELKISW